MPRRLCYDNQFLFVTMSFEQKIRWISASIDPRHLTELKYRFKNEINSKRKYSQVNSFFDVFGILMTRGVVSQEDVTILDQICQEYFRVSFSEVPDSFNTASSFVAQQSHQLPFIASALTNRPSGLTNASAACSGSRADKPIPPDVISTIVAGNITEKQWRPFARALQVDTESISNVPSNADKVHKILATFLTNTEQHQHWPLLEVALEKIRRMDLRDKCRALLTPQ